MACEHTQPTQLMAMAENWCLKENLPLERRSDWEFWFAENHDAWGHKAVRMAVRWDGKSWVLIVLDRLPDALPDHELNFKALKR